MKKDFIFNYYTKQYKHKDYPIYFDFNEFNDISDQELEQIIQQKLKDINLELASLKPKKPKPKNLTDEEITNSFAEIRRKLAMSESFKDYFYRQIIN